MKLELSSLFSKKKSKSFGCADDEKVGRQVREKDEDKNKGKLSLSVRRKFPCATETFLSVYGKYLAGRNYGNSEVFLSPSCPSFSAFFLFILFVFISLNETQAV
jgi:hypothetical protein